MEDNKWFSDAPIVVTGGVGFIGSHMVTALAQKGYKVVVIDRHLAGGKEGVVSGVKYHRVDLNKTDQIHKILLKYKPKIIYHFAGHTRLREALQDPQQDCADNLGSTLSLVQACIRLKAEENYQPAQLVFSSTSAVYGALETPPFSEETAPQPNSPYGIAKLAAENYLRWYGEHYEVVTTFLRYANVYGPRQSHIGEAGVVPKFMNALVHDQPIMVYGKGDHRRDYIFVADVVTANEAVVEHQKAGVFVVGTGKPTSTKTIAELCLSVSGKKQKLNHRQNISPEQASSWLDASRLSKETGWRPKTALKEGLRQTYDWYKKHAL